MFESIMNFFKKLGKNEKQNGSSKEAAKERLHLVLMQDRANVSADFLDMMRQEIIDVIKKYIDVDEESIDVRLTNKTNDDGTTGAPALYANIPIMSIKEEARAATKEKKEETKENVDPKKETIQQEEMTEEKVDENKEERKEETKIEPSNSSEQETKEETPTVEDEPVKEEKQEEIKEEEKGDEPNNVTTQETAEEVKTETEIKQEENN